MREFIGKSLGVLAGFLVLLALNVYWIKVENALFQTLTQTGCIALTIFFMTRYQSKNSTE